MSLTIQGIYDVKCAIEKALFSWQSDSESQLVIKIEACDWKGSSRIDFCVPGLPNSLVSLHDDGDIFITRPDSRLTAKFKHNNIPRTIKIIEAELSGIPSLDSLDTPSYLLNDYPASSHT